MEGEDALGKKMKAKKPEAENLLKASKGGVILLPDGKFPDGVLEQVAHFLSLSEDPKKSDAVLKKIRKLMKRGSTSKKNKKK